MTLNFRILDLRSLIFFVIIFSLRNHENVEAQKVFNRFAVGNASLDEMKYLSPFPPLRFVQLLLQGLRQLRHAPITTVNFFSEYDYIVVGSGPGGSTVAARLAEIPCVTVLLLEAGKLPPWLTEVPAFARLFFGTDIDWSYYTVPQKHTGAGLKNRQIVFPSGKAVGGSSVWNGMVYVRGNRQNFDDWAKNGASGWSYEEVLPYFKKMERNLNPDLIETEFHGFDGPLAVETPRYHPTIQKASTTAAMELGIPIRDINGQYQLGYTMQQGTTVKGRRCSAAKAYLVPSDHKKNLHIVSNAFVKKVIIENKVATGVQFDFRGKQYEIRARREVILSAGTVNTPQLLMLSGIGPKALLDSFQIPVVQNLPVGENLQDHPGTVAVFQLSNKLRPITEKLRNPLNIAQYIFKKTGPLTTTEGVVGMGFFTNETTQAPEAVPDYQLYFTHGVDFVLRDQTNIREDYYQQMFGPYQKDTIFFCIAQILNPKSRGTVKIRSIDPYDPPEIDPNYFDHPQDLRDLVEGLKQCYRVAATDAMRKIGAKPLSTLVPGCEELFGDEDAYLTCFVRAFVNTPSHQTSTAKMGNPEDPTTVVDPQLRVLGIKGLRVVDASVMPTITSGNTVAPTYMIGEKAADIIKQTIRCPAQKG